MRQSNQVEEVRKATGEEGLVERSVSDKNCSHARAVPYFGPVYSCPDCGAMKVRDICTGGWRNQSVS